MGAKTLVDDTDSSGAFIIRTFDIFYTVIRRSTFYLHVILI